MNLDWVGAITTGLTAMCVFAIHVVTSPSRRHWITLPSHIRASLFVFGMMLMIRSIDFTEISSQPTVLGHINAKGALTSISMFVAVFLTVVHILKYTYPARVWTRLQYIARLAACKPNGRRVGAAVAELATQGVKVFPPGAPAHAILEVEDTRPVTDIYHEEFSR